MMIGKNSRDVWDEKEFMGFPIVTRYKYLGVRINKDLNLKDHMEMVQSKFALITVGMTGLRNFNNLELNKNLYKTIILPSYTLGFSMYIFQNKAGKQIYENQLKRTFKKFWIIPRNTENQILAEIIEPFKQIMRKRINKIQRKVFVRKQCVYKKIPKGIRQILIILGAKRCKQHLKPARQKHLQTEHGIKINVKRWIKEYNNVEHQNRNARRGRKKKIVEAIKGEIKSK